MLSNRASNIIAGLLLAIMFLLAFFSIKGDTFTFDETAHTAAGFSYLTQKDYRLNPEHPPLIKDLAALPLLFLNLNFPKDHASWVQQEPPQWWFQFDFATQFLYASGNDPDKIMFWAKLPMILLLIFLGWFLFYWTKKLLGKKAALLTLFFFSFSPTFLAHGRLVTTDVGAALGALLATFFWLKFLKNPEMKNIIFAGLIFGLAMLIKFSLILLIPFFILITIIYALVQTERKFLFNIIKYFSLSLLAGLIGFAFVVWPVYQYHILDYPAERQIRDTQSLLNSTSVQKPLVNLNLWLVQQPLLRPLSQYLLGLLLAVNRSATGNTTFFLGKISAEGWRSYFPIIYLIKEPLALHIFTLFAILYAGWLIRKEFWKSFFQRLKNWIKNHFSEFSLLFFLLIYWLTSLSAKLNIGVRHLLPAFPFAFILLGGLLVFCLKPSVLKIKYLLLAVLLFWQAVSVILVYPHFLAYFNETAGGPDKGYLYAVDSNLDWGQDLKRLKQWLDENGIDKIYLDYFGGGNAQYYLGEKYASWWGKRDPQEIPGGSYLAVSATQLQGGRAIPVKNFAEDSSYYLWLNQQKLVTKIGYSIFVYQISVY